MSYNLDSSISLSELLGLNAPSKIMTIGQRIAVKHFSMYEYAYAFIVNIEKDFIRVKFRSSFPSVDFFPEDPIVMTFASNDKIYIASGEIVTLEAMEPLTIEVKVSKIEKRNSLRRDERFFVSVACNIDADELESPVFGIVKNLSYTGFKINSKDEIKDVGRLKISLNIDKNTKLNCFGKVVRKEKLGLYHEYGIQIEDITRNNKLTLQHYINTLKSLK